MALGNSIPALVCRFAEHTTMGFMSQGIGLGDWLTSLDKPKPLDFCLQRPWRPPKIPPQRRPNRPKLRPSCKSGSGKRWLSCMKPQPRPFNGLTSSVIKIHGGDLGLGTLIRAHVDVFAGRIHDDGDWAILKNVAGHLDVMAIRCKGDGFLRR